MTRHSRTTQSRLTLGLLFLALGTVRVFAGCATPNPDADSPSETEDRPKVERKASPDPEAITQSPWRLVVLHASASGASVPLNDVVVTARFSDDGQVTGRSGCNRYTAKYEVSGDSLAIDPAATTRRMCPPPRMEVEEAVLAAMTRIAHYRVLGDSLALSASPNGRDLLWVAAADTTGAPG